MTVGPEKKRKREEIIGSCKDIVKKMGCDKPFEDIDVESEEFIENASVIPDNRGLFEQARALKEPKDYTVKHVNWNGEEMKGLFRRKRDGEEPPGILNEPVYEEPLGTLVESERGGVFSYAHLSNKYDDDDEVDVVEDRFTFINVYGEEAWDSEAHAYKPIRDYKEPRSDDELEPEDKWPEIE
ncbi:MAG: hypothetical protein ACLFQ8_03525 [Candidatus Aenigmatarchaeota archaeon]